MSPNAIRWIGSLSVIAALVVGVVALVATPTVHAAGSGGQPCGGIAGLTCPGPNQVCVDDPRDNCDPKKGGADCIGICRGPGGGGNTQ